MVTCQDNNKECAVRARREEGEGRGRGPGCLKYECLTHEICHLWSHLFLNSSPSSLICCSLLSAAAAAALVSVTTYLLTYLLPHCNHLHSLSLSLSFLYLLWLLFSRAFYPTQLVGLLLLLLLGVVVVPPYLVPHITTNKQTTSSNSFPSSSFRLPSHSVCWVTEWLSDWL